MTGPHYLATLAYNNKDLTMQVVQDGLNQDIPVQVVVWDNGSKDGTVQDLDALGDPRLTVISSDKNIGVGPAWNQLCGLVFGGILGPPSDHVLIVNNDVRLRPDTYRNLLVPKGGLVTAVNVGSWEKASTAQFIVEEEPILRGGPDFSCFLVYDWFHQAIGTFPEVYYPGWFEDNETHWVARCKGLDKQIFSVTMPYYHIGSQTLKNNPDIQALNAEMFEKNKQLYIKRWGGPPGREIFTEPYGPNNP